MEESKMPISKLTELCSKVRQRPLFMDLDISEVPEHLKSSEKKWWVKCCALGKTAIAGAPLKQSAKHAAAAIIIRKLEAGSDISDDDEEDVKEKVSKGDYVTDLLDLCVVKNYHKPEYKLVESYGPTHDPCYTFECTLDSIRRRATAGNKKLAKQLAAKEVFEIFITAFPNIEKKIAVIDRDNLVKEEAHKKITSYMKLKEKGKESKMGTTIAQRSNFFNNYHNDEFIAALKEILQKNIDEDLKYEELKKELETLWECKVGDYYDTGLKEFQCLVDFEQFTVYLVAREELLKSEVVNYFCEMLNVPCN